MATQLTITLPNAQAEYVRRKIESGEYASESDLIAALLAEAGAEAKAVDDWLRDVVAPRADRLQETPAKFLTSEEVGEELARRRALRNAAE